MKQSALFVVAYLLTLPVLNAVHIAEHHRHIQLDTEQTAVSETLPDCDLCYVYQNQKLVDSNVEDVFLASSFSPYLEIPTASLISTSSYYVSLRAPPSLAV